MSLLRDILNEGGLTNSNKNVEEVLVPALGKMKYYLDKLEMLEKRFEKDSHALWQLKNKGVTSIDPYFFSAQLKKAKDVFGHAYDEIEDDIKLLNKSKT